MSSRSAEDDSTPLQAARQKITTIFRGEDSWYFPRNDEEQDEEATSDNIADKGAEILNLLREFPVLASEQYQIVDGGDTMVYPLVYFLWNSLGADMLDEVLALYPAVAEHPMRHCFPLNNYLERLYRPGVSLSDETLIWLLTHITHASIDLKLGVSFVWVIRRYQELGSHLSRPVIEAFLRQMDSAYLHSGPLDAMLNAGYDNEILELVMRKYADAETSSISFRGDWSLDRKLADMLQCYLPQFENIDFEQRRWTKEGWATILTALQKCEQHFRVKLTVSSNWFVSDPEIMSRMLKFLQEKHKDMNVCLQISGGRLQRKVDNARFLDKLLVQMRGLEPGTLDSLTLKKFVALKQEQLLELLEYVSHFEIKQSDLARDSVSSRPQPISLAPDALIATQQLWSMIRETPGSTRCASCTIKTSYGMSGQEKVLTKVSLDLSAAQRDNTFPQDLTPLVLSLLKCMSLKNLSLRCGTGRGTSTTLASFPKLTIQPFCCALKSNMTIESIIMEGVRVESSCSQEVPSKLLAVVKNTNSNLERLSIWNKQVAYTSLKAAASWNENIQHVDYATAKQLDFFLWLNRCGRKKLGCQAAKVDDLIQILLKTKKQKDCEMMWELRNLLGHFSEDIPAELREDVQYFSAVYENLKGSVNDWGNAAAVCFTQHASQTAAIYELLRGFPSLWCDSLNGKTFSPEAKRKRMRDCHEFYHDGPFQAKKGRVSASVFGSTR